MRIAVTSQNLKSITAHAGKCRRFWIYEIDSGRCLERHLVEIPLDATFHAAHCGLPEALQGVDVLITGSMGSGLHERLKRSGITPVVTPEENPDIAITAYLNGTLPVLAEKANACHHHGHHH